MTADAAQADPKSPSLVTQMSRFGVIGCLSAAIDYGSLLLFVTVGVGADLARVLSFACGSTSAYLCNRRWTFDARRDGRELALVMGCYAVSFLIIVIVNTVALRVLPPSSRPVTLAWLLSQSLASTFNFLMQRVLIFRR